MIDSAESLDREVYSVIIRDLKYHIERDFTWGHGGLIFTKRGPDGMRWPADEPALRDLLGLNALHHMSTGSSLYRLWRLAGGRFRG